MKSEEVDREEETVMETKVRILLREVCSLEDSLSCLCFKLRSIYGHGGIKDLPFETKTVEEVAPKERPPTIGLQEDAIKRIADASMWLDETSNMV